MPSLEYNIAQVLAHTIVFEARQLDPAKIFFNEDPSAPSPIRAANQVSKAFVGNAPKVSSAFTGQILPTEQAIASSEATIAPQIAAINRALFGGNLQAFSQGTLANITGAGGDVARAGTALGKEINPEFFNIAGAGSDVGSAASKAITDTLTNPLTRGEETSIERNLNRLNSTRGVSANPSNLSTVSAGITYGQAGRDRLNQAIANANQFLPSAGAFLGAAKNPAVDAITNPNPALIQTAFGGAERGAPPGQTTLDLSKQLLGGQQQQQLSAQDIDANRRKVYETVFGSLPDY